MGALNNPIHFERPEGVVALSVHRKISSSRPRRIVGTSVALLAFAVGGIGILASSASADGHLGHVVVTEHCTPTPSLEFTAYNDVEGSLSTYFMVMDNDTKLPAGLDLSGVAFGSPVSDSLTLGAHTSYSYYVTDANGAYQLPLLEGTLNCGTPGPISVTPVAPVVTDQVIICIADYTLQTVSASIAIPATAGIDYSIDGTVATGTVLVAAPGTYLVAATAKSGHVLTTPYNVYQGVNAGVAPACEKPPVVTPPVDTPPVVTPPVVTPVVAAPVVAKAATVLGSKVVTKAKTTAVSGPLASTDYVGAESMGLGWFVAFGLGVVFIGLGVGKRGLSRRKVQENRR